MKPIFSCTAAMLMILAGDALYRPPMMAARPGSATPLNSTTSPASPTQKMRLAENFGKLPLSFEVNRGQADAQVKFLAHGPGYTLFLTPDEAVLSLGQHGAFDKRQVSGRARGLVPMPPATDLSRQATNPQRGTTSAALRMEPVGANSHAAVGATEELARKDQLPHRQ